MLLLINSCQLSPAFSSTLWCAGVAALSRGTLLDWTGWWGELALQVAQSWRGGPVTSCCPSWTIPATLCTAHSLSRVCSEADFSPCPAQQTDYSTTLINARLWQTEPTENSPARLSLGCLPVNQFIFFPIFTPYLHLYLCRYLPTLLAFHIQPSVHFRIYISQHSLFLILHVFLLLSTFSKRQICICIDICTYIYLQLHLYYL